LLAPEFVCFEFLLKIRLCQAFRKGILLGSGGFECPFAHIPSDGGMLKTNAMNAMLMSLFNEDFECPAKRAMPRRTLVFMLCLSLAIVCLNSGCSIRKLAIDKMGDALAQSGSTFSNDDDPELIRAAAPFSLKLMETLLAENPCHQGLLLAATKNFAQYSYAFVQMDADEMESRDLAAATAMRDRAKRLYLRARNYGLRGLETTHPSFEKLLRANAPEAAKACTKKEAPLLYWTSMSWAAAIALAKDDPDLIADLPFVDAMVQRCQQLDPDLGEGSLHSFLIVFESVRKSVPGDPYPRIQKHFERAMELSRGQFAGPLVSYAEEVCVLKQNLPEFQALLKKALALDPKARPENQLENLIYQRRARWLLSRTDELFLTRETEEKP
jgi:predicted anti-sigma-YlaC factor YlaD